MCFTDIVQVVTQIVTTITAVVTAYLAYKTYFKAPEQENESEPESASDESAAVGITEALMFKTSKQKTWLSVTDQGLACRIDDTRAGKGGPQWILSRTELKTIIDTETFSVNPGYKVNTGTFSIGPKKNWLYTKSLYPQPEYLLGVIKQLLNNAIS